MFQVIGDDVYYSGYRVLELDTSVPPSIRDQVETALHAIWSIEDLEPPEALQDENDDLRAELGGARKDLRAIAGIVSIVGSDADQIQRIRKVLNKSEVDL